ISKKFLPETTNGGNANLIFFSLVFFLSQSATSFSVLNLLKLSMHSFKILELLIGMGASQLLKCSVFFPTFATFFKICKIFSLILTPFQLSFISPFLIRKQPSLGIVEKSPVW